MGNSIVAGMKERNSNQITAQVIENVKRPTLHAFIHDDLKSYRNMDGFNHQFVCHSAGEYVREQVHVNGVKSFWMMLKCAHKGTFHKFSHPQTSQQICPGILWTARHPTA